MDVNHASTQLSDTFLIVAPGITIRDRLRVLLPNDPQNHYQQRDLLPPGELERLGRAKILITNFHAFQPREKIKASKLNKTILGAGKQDVFTETPDEMVRRVCWERGTKKNIIVLNDEAHHSYRRRPELPEEILERDDKAEAKDRNTEARIWVSGIEAVKAKIVILRAPEPSFRAEHYGPPAVAPRTEKPDPLTAIRARGGLEPDRFHDGVGIFSRALRAVAQHQTGAIPIHDRKDAGRRFPAPRPCRIHHGAGLECRDPIQPPHIELEDRVGVLAGGFPASCNVEDVRHALVAGMSGDRRIPHRQRRPSDLIPPTVGRRIGGCEVVRQCDGLGW